VTAGGKTVTATRDISQQILTKSHGAPDYKNKTIPWAITFNKDQYVMNNVKLEDTFLNKGLTLKPESLKITNVKTKAVLEKGTEYTLTDNGENGFLIEFLSEIKDEHKIEYVTDFNYEARQDKDKTALNNKATLIWTVNGVEVSKEATEPFIPDQYTQANGFKNGSYNAVTKEITWKIGVNYNSKTLKNANVIDEIIGDQELLQDSLKVYKMNLTGGANGTTKGELLDSSAYTITWDPNDKPGFKVEFRKEINTPYLIEYKTSLKDQQIVRTYENTATLNNGADKVTELPAKVSVLHGGSYTSKTGEQKGKIIDWKVNINFSQSTISNVKIIDTSSSNQLLLENTFELYATHVNENGNVSEGEKLEKGKDYTIELKQDGSGFELSFPNTISTPYILKYQSYILAAVGAEVNNDVILTGEQIKEQSTSSKSKIVVKRTSGMGTGTGETGSLELTKVDAEDSSKVLEGATFSLIDQESGIVIKTLTTGADGKVKFDNLLYGNYLLKENKAPEGYIVGIQDAKLVEINGAHQLNVKNEKIIQAVELTKVDKETDVSLSGAEFELQRKEESGYVKVSSHTTNDDGQIIVNNLPAGEYQFVETKAPEHYLLDESSLTFKITDNQTKVIKVKKANERGKGKLIVTKIDGADQTPLAGAEFKVFNSKNELVGTKTTNDEGKVLFENLPYDHYSIVETAAPEGYAIAIEDGKTAVKIDKADNHVIIENNKIIRDVKLTKVYAYNENIRLVGVIFKLMYKADEDAQYTLVAGKERLETDENGEILIRNLAPGYYQLIEIKTISGFLIDMMPIEFQIQEEQLSVLELVMKNFPIPEYYYPEPNTPKEPVYSEGKDSDSGIIVQNGNKHDANGKKPSNSNSLPQTGESSNHTMNLVGLLLILTGTWFMVSRRNEGANK